jgi:CRP/FNR family cyclic AMP-dependent transcriptional regulator
MQLATAIPTRFEDREREVLRSLSIFSVVSEEEVQWAISVMKRRRFARGEVVYHQDDPPGSLFIVMDGAVKMERCFDNGRQHTIGWVTRGSFFGTHSLFGVVSRTENAVAVTGCELLVFGGNAFRDFLHRNPPAMEALLEVVINKWRACLDRFSETVLLDVRERTVRVLLRLAHRIGSLEDDGALCLRDLTQRELASWVGASRESVNRALHSLARLGLIRVYGGKIIVLDLEGLTELDTVQEV